MATLDRFDALVARLEREAHEHPSGYKLRVGLLAALGYGYIFVILGLLIALAVGTIALLSSRFSYGAGKITFVLLAFAFVIVRSLWVRMSPPDGRVLRQAEVPDLFQTIEEVRRTLGGPKLRQVLLTDDFNAAVVQHPRLGIFGWYENYLLVGLPLMEALSPDQFRAVLAHEFGHLSGAHGRFGAWVYRVRQTWGQLLERLEEKGSHGAFVFTLFLRWYAPIFDAYSFALARAQEYQADRDAVRVASARTTADMLVLLTVNGALLEEQFWPDVYKAATRQATPTSAPFSEMRAVLSHGAAPMQAEQWLRRALHMPSSSDDTHPSLAARLAALNQEARIVPPPSTTAADAFLGDALPSLRTEIDQQWRQAIADPWRDHHIESQQDQQRLDELHARAQREQLDVEAAYQRAALTESLHGGEAALPLYQTVLDLDPAQAPALFAVGRLRLAANDEHGIALIERAMDLDQAAIVPGCQEIYTFLIGEGQQQRAESYYRRGVEQAQIMEMAEAERDDVRLLDTLLPHALPAEQIDHLSRQLARVQEIEQAYLTRKEVQHRPDEPLFVLGLVVGGSRRRELVDEDQAVLLERLSNELENLPVPTNAYIVNKRYMLHDMFKQVPDALIYQRETTKLT